MTVDAPGPFADVDGQIGGTLQIGVDSHAGGQDPKIRGHRRLEGQQSEAPVFDGEGQHVDVVVVVNDVLGHDHVGLEQGVGGSGHHLGGHGGHTHHVGPHVIQVTMERLSDFFWHRARPSSET